MCCLALLTLTTACQSNEQKSADPLVAAAQQATQSPEALAKAQAWKLATTLPPARPTSALDLRAGVEQMLPVAGSLELVAATAQKLEPAILALPPLWASPKGGYPAVAPGYRIPFTAVLRCKPSATAGAPTVPLYSPNGRDTLASFRVGGINLNVPGRERYEVREIRPTEALTVHGVLYTYLGQDSQRQPALVVYPYHNAGNIMNQKMVFLPLTR